MLLCCHLLCIPSRASTIAMVMYLVLLYTKGSERVCALIFLDFLLVLLECSEWFILSEEFSAWHFPGVF